MDYLTDVTARLQLFYGMIRTAYPINHWTYDRDLKLIYADADALGFTNDVVSLIKLADTIRSQISGGDMRPFLLETDYDFFFLTAPEYEKNQIRQIHLFGPLYTGSASTLLLQQRMISTDLSLSQRRLALSRLQEIPVIPYSTLLQYAVMLHYALTYGTISTSDIRLAGCTDRGSAAGERQNAAGGHAVKGPHAVGGPREKKLSSSHQGVWESEQQIIRMIREGDPNYHLALSHSMKLSSGVRADFGDPLRHAKNNLLVLLTLATRATIEGGLSPDIAYGLNDTYAESIEHAPSMTALMTISSEMMDTFIARVQEIRTRQGLSAAIQSACYYIDSHLSEPVNIHQLASQAGYADYYFSQKFKKETGQSVQEYLADRRIAKARELLRDPSMDIADIQEAIGVPSRSRFYELFKEKTGMSPAQYRERPVT